LKTAEISVELIGHFGDDNTVVNAARVSFAKDSCMYTDDQNVKLIRYLAKHGHLSPFNHAFLSFRVKAPIFVARQLVKHKFLPWNEVSRRYVDDEPEYYLPHAFRVRADNVKQGSSNELTLANSMWGFDSAVEDLSSHTEESLLFYRHLLDQGVCPEQARMVLPLNTMTEWVWSGTLGAWLDMLKLRLDPHTQAETRHVAELIHGFTHVLFPISTEARLDL
jgi:thymidylate synthase (FAD)